MHPSEGTAPVAWQDGFARLGPAFLTHLQPTPLPTPQWVARNDALAAQMGLPAEWFASDAALQALTGNDVLPGSQPYASVYSGHQFGHWAGQLGDGRAITLGETTSGWELQLKGAGRTPYSRGGDGRAVLRSSIREYLCSEAMHALGIPTTRALALTASPGTVYRETAETAAVVTRAAPCLVRFGHFEHFAARDQLRELRALADYVLARYYPACVDGWRDDAGKLRGNAYAALLHAVGQRTAALLAQWQAVGFCHGVMNTDNMSILGLTIDYGPFQFLDGFHPGHICNHSDTHGRYAFERQPQVAYWNLFCLGQALLPLIEDEATTVQALEAYRPAFSQAFTARICDKLGIPGAAVAAHSAAAQSVIGGVLQALAAEQVDYPIFWQRLSQAAHDGDFAPVRALWLDPSAWDAWLLTYQELQVQVGIGLDAHLMQNTNPRYVLRNHVGEQAIRAAQAGDFSVVQSLQTVLTQPFDAHPDHSDWAGFPPDWASTIEISCSS